MSAEEEDWDAYVSALHISDHKKRTAPMRPLERDCGDCAVVFGLYKPISDALARQPANVRRFLCARWFCHAHPERACKGNIDNISALRAQAKRAAP